MNISILLFSATTVLLLLSIITLIIPKKNNITHRHLFSIVGWFLFMNSLTSMIVLNGLFYGFKESISGASANIIFSSENTLFYVSLTLVGFIIGTLFSIYSVKTEKIKDSFKIFMMPIFILIYIVLARLSAALLFNVPKGNPHLAQGSFNIEYFAGICSVDLPVILLILQMIKKTKLRLWSLGLVLWILYIVFVFYHITTVNYESIVYGSILINMLIISLFISAILFYQIVKNKNNKNGKISIILKANRLKFLYEYIANNYFAVVIFLLITFVLTNLMKDALVKKDYMVIVSWFLSNLQTIIILLSAIILPLFGALFWYVNGLEISVAKLLNPRIINTGFKQILFVEGGYFYIVWSFITISFAHVLILIKKIAEKL